MESAMNTTMCATVCRVCRRCLLVCDHCTRQAVAVRTDQARCFRPGDHVCIYFDGVMTRSIPPQINADCIECCC